MSVKRWDGTQWLDITDVSDAPRSYGGLVQAPNVTANEQGGVTLRGGTTAIPGTLFTGDAVLDRTSGGWWTGTAGGIKKVPAFGAGTPSPIGTAAGGTSQFTVREDHVHALSAAIPASGLTGATAATRYVGGTTSGAPVSGTFAIGDFVIAQNGGLWICTAAGTPGSWINPASGATSWTNFALGAGFVANDGGVGYPAPQWRIEGDILRTRGGIGRTGAVNFAANTVYPGIITRPAGIPIPPYTVSASMTGSWQQPGGTKLALYGSAHPTAGSRGIFDFVTPTALPWISLDATFYIG